jgi:CBS domain-containing protein
MRVTTPCLQTWRPLVVFKRQPTETARSRISTRLQQRGNTVCSMASCAATRLSRLSTFAAAERASASRAAAAADPLNAGLAQLLHGRATGFASVPASLLVVDAAVLMARRKVGSLIVLEEEQQQGVAAGREQPPGRSTSVRYGTPPVEVRRSPPGMRGIVTERDVLLAVPRLAGGAEVGLSVADIMSRDPKTIAADATIGDAMEVMTEHGFRHLPVVDGETLVGLISMRDVTKKLTEDHKEAMTSLNVQLGRLSALGGGASDAATAASAEETNEQIESGSSGKKSWWRAAFA